MTVYVALLRAVNVGGTGKLAMSALKTMCDTVGFERARTYIASGNVVFASDLAEAEVRTTLENVLAAHAGRAVEVLVRSAGEMAELLRQNPFADRPGNRTVAMFVDQPLGSDAIDAATGVADEELRLGPRAIYIAYGSGMAASKLRVPAGKRGTTRNMNTVTKLATMAAEL